MKKIKIIQKFLLIVLISASLPLYAQEKSETIPKKKIELTKQQVEQSIKLLPYFLKNVYKGKKGTQIKLDEKELNKLATENGFRDYQEFLKSSSAVMMAYAYLKLKTSEAMLSSQLKKIKPETAKTFKPQMDSIEKAIKAYEKELSPVTVKAIIPYMTQIEKILKSNR
jgi:hypothetical protein